MEPTLNVHALIIIQEQNEYETGDIVTYKDKNGSVVTHRIIEKQEDKLITKGDNNNTTDEPIEQKQIFGKVRFYSNFLGSILMFLTTPEPWFIMIGMIIVYYLLKQILIK